MRNAALKAFWRSRRSLLACVAGVLHYSWWAALAGGCVLGPDLDLEPVR